MSAALFDHTVLSAWAGDAAAADALSFEADLAAMLRFEAALAEAEAECGVIPTAAARRIAATCDGFRPDISALRARARVDGVVAPGLIDQLRRALGPEAAPHLHVGATSQDVIDTSLMLRLAPLLADYQRRLSALRDDLAELDHRWGDRPLMAYTRLRAALPGRAHDRLSVWACALDEAQGRLRTVRETQLAVQFAGPVGVLDRLGGRAASVRARLAAQLELADPGGSWQVRRGRIGELAACLALVATALGKIGLDVGLMAQDGVDQIALEGGGSSSMPHKVNPVDAELLVALARHNAALLGAVGQAGLHEYERSGSGWTLEWLTLPAMLTATGAALNAGARLLAAVRRIGAPSA